MSTSCPQAAPRRGRRAARRLVWTFFIGTLLGAAALAGVNVWVLLSAERDIRTDPDAVPRSDAAIIFGSSVYADGALSPVTYDRVQTGVDLYRAGLVAKLLISGDSGRGAYDEVHPMRASALAAGVPAADIFIDPAGYSTYDTVRRAHDVFRVATAVLVTQRFHLPRALMIARMNGLEAVGFPADRRRYQGAARYRLREALARPKDLLKCFYDAAPSVSSEPIPITADGRITLDDVARGNEAER